ncbi:MAG: glycosyltransferase family 4 protein [Alphaproteobacteria bacterium]|nr:glycosyltransferase family 4 protein [Alphaproteobacteria bacterium]QQS57481.1 MAG: glycosyltransferase family 4 protein [Alphaproteobacteria bacterium]
MARGKLLYVINHPDWFWSHRLPLALGAKETGYEVLVAMPDGENNKKLSEYGFQGFDLPSFENKGSPLTAVKTMCALQKLLQQQKPDIVHAITLKYAFMTGIVTRFDKSSRTVHTIAGLGYLFSGEGIRPKALRLLIGPLLKFALKGPRTRIIVQNPDDLDLLVRRGFVREDRTILIRGSGVDTETFKPSGQPEEDPPIVLMPTRLLRDKGVSVFIDAARILKKKGVNARFQIAGGLSPNSPGAITEPEMRQMIADASVEWLGKRDDMPDLLARTTLVAYPSHYREGVPKVLLEAAASGRAIVTTNHPGCREAVQHGVNGLLVPIRNAPSLAAAIEELLLDAPRRKSMENASRIKAVTEFNLRLVVTQTLKNYEIKNPFCYGLNT